MKHFFILILLLSFNLLITAQPFYRISADFSIKSTQVDSSKQLIMGTVFYDINEKQIIYDIIFPEKEIWVIEDTLTYKIVDDTIKEILKSPNIRETTIFHLALNGQMSDYGLKTSSFTLDKVEGYELQTITTWIPPEEYREYIGKILISKKENKLAGIIFFSGKDEIMSKQFFSKYKNCNGLQFPSEILIIKYFDGIEIYEKTTYKNIKVNNYENNDNYHFELDKY